jgi:hypothetical protein
MDEYIEELTEYYQSKHAYEKSKSKSKKMVIDIERKEYRYYKDYLKELHDKINEEKKRILELKYDVLYGLTNDTLEEYDQIEEKIGELIKERDLQILKYKDKEETKKQEIQDLVDEIKGLLMHYREIPEDKKRIYLEIQKKRKEINEIINKYSCILTNKVNNKYIYTLTQDYQPIMDHEILIGADETAHLEVEDLEDIDLDAVN